MKKKEVFNVAFSAIFLSLAVVFEFVSKVIPFFTMPNGGGVSITMLALAIVSIVCGFKYGVTVGIAFGLINCFLIDGYSFNLYSFILDYIVGFGVISVIAVFRKQILSGKKKHLIIGLLLGGLLRWIASGFSGVINAKVWGYDSLFLEGIFGSGKGSTIWLYIYSFLYYNLPYIGVSIIICIIIGLLLQKRMIKISEGEIFKKQE